MLIPTASSPVLVPQATARGPCPQTLPRHGAHAKYFRNPGRAGFPGADRFSGRVGDGTGRGEKGIDPMTGLYFEEFEEGQVFDHAVSRTVSEMDNVLFSTLTMNPQPLHLDEEFAKRTEFGTRLVNSLFTLGLVIGISGGETTPRKDNGKPGDTGAPLPQAGVSR